MYVLLMIDIFFLVVVERLSHFIQRWSGYNNFQQSRAVSVLFFSISSYRLWRGEKYMFMWLVSVIYFAIFIRGSIFLERVILDKCSRTGYGYRNPLEYVYPMRVARIMCIFLVFTGVGFCIIRRELILHLLEYSVFTLSLFLVCSTPLPPGDSKFREFANSLRLKLSPAPA
jgi:hypothetical protein